MKKQPPQHFKTIHSILTQYGGSLEELRQNDKLYSEQLKELDIKLNYTLLQVDKALRKLEALNS